MRASLALLGLLFLSSVAALEFKERAATLAFLGDVMLGRDVARANQGSDWDALFEDVAPQIRQADHAFANLESPITSAPLVRETYDLRAPKEAIRALALGGIDVVSLANNHAMDAGQLGLLDTRTALSSIDVHPLGPKLEPWIVQVKGFKLAWIALDDTLSRIDLEGLRQELDTLQNIGDLIIVSIHWGNELDPAPNERQRDLAAELAAAGADLIIGHHPHVLQPITWIWGVGRGRPTLVAYSLGNAIFDQAAPPSARLGALFWVEIGRSGLRRACAFPFQANPDHWIVSANHESAERISHMVGLTCTQQIISSVEGQ